MKSTTVSTAELHAAYHATDVNSDPAPTVQLAEPLVKGGQSHTDDQVSGDAFCVGSCIFFVAAMVCFYGAWRLLS
jgi:hypothetical protein